MRKLRSEPVIYELDTWVWLDALGRARNTFMTLANVPDDVWDEVALSGVNAVWLMGVWQRSAEGRRVATENESFRASFANALPGFSDDDVVGSPYCVANYVVDERLGGPAGLAHARSKLAERGLSLVLDYVPNHVAFDHPWTNSHPEFFVQSKAAVVDRSAFVKIGDYQIALGRDPYFPPWPDVAQLNAFAPALRDATAATLKSIGEQCDGVRTDMAMLFVTDVFERTWGDMAGERPATEFWVDVIANVHGAHPDFTFIAEAYWDMESVLIGQGFDYAYDKRLYDRLVHENADSVRAHLVADTDYQKHMLRFLENHDEPRAAATFDQERERAAAIVNAFTPGGKLYHEGQFEGRRVFNPVPLGRRTDEPTDENRKSFYTRLLEVAGSNRPESSWQLCDTTGWPDNNSCENLLAWTWEAGDIRHLAIVNFSPNPAQGQVHLPWNDLDGHIWNFSDLLGSDEFKREGLELTNTGLFVDLPRWHSHILRVS